MTLHITSLGGGMPLQGEGKTSDGRLFYFRARYQAWSMSIGATEEELYDAPSWFWREPWGDSEYAASHMPEEAGKEIILSLGDMIDRGVAPPREHVGVPEAEVSARRLARFMIDDICMYNADAIDHAPSHAAAFEAVASSIEEARRVYQQPTDPAYHSIFEDALLKIERRRDGRFEQEPWIYDTASAESVALRWIALAQRADASRRNGILEEGRRWLEAWTPEGPARAAWRAIFARAG